MKDTNLTETAPAGSTGANEVSRRKTLRGGARSLVQRFKERQRLPVVTMLGESKNWSASLPPDGLELGSFGHH